MPVPFADVLRCRARERTRIIDTDRLAQRAPGASSSSSSSGGDGGCHGGSSDGDAATC